MIDAPTIEQEVVAPRAGAWIETSTILRYSADGLSRPPRGGVD